MIKLCKLYDSLGEYKLADAYRIIISGFDEAIQKLKSNGVTQDKIDLLVSLPNDQKGLYLKQLFVNPNAEYQPTFKVSDEPTEFEKKFAQYANPVYNRWVLIRLRRLREKGSNSSYVGFGNNLNAFYQEYHNIFNQVYDWYSHAIFEDDTLDLIALDLKTAMNRSQQWHDTIAGEGEGLMYLPLSRDEDGNINDPRVVYQFDDGYFIVALDNSNDLKTESNRMNNCVGSYCSEVENGYYKIYSLRTPQNKPLVTIGFDGEHSIIKEINGVNNDTPPYAIRQYVNEFLNYYTPDAKWHGSNPNIERPEITWESNHPEDVETYISDTIYGPYIEDVEKYQYDVRYEEEYEHNFSYGDTSDLVEQVLKSVQDWHNDDEGETYDPDYSKVAKTLAEGLIYTDLCKLNSLQYKIPFGKTKETGKYDEYYLKIGVIPGTVYDLTYEYDHDYNHWAAKFKNQFINDVLHYLLISLNQNFKNSFDSKITGGKFNNLLDLIHSPTLFDREDNSSDDSYHKLFDLKSHNLGLQDFKSEDENYMYANNQIKLIKLAQKLDKLGLYDEADKIFHLSA